jgi:hypothetical protein
LLGCSPTDTAKQLIRYLNDFAATSTDVWEARSALLFLQEDGFAEELVRVGEEAGKAAADKCVILARATMAEEMATRQALTQRLRQLWPALCSEYRQRKTTYLKYCQTAALKASTEERSFQERMTEWLDDRDEYGYTDQSRKPRRDEPPADIPNPKRVLERPYWLLAERGGKKVLIGETMVDDVRIIDYTTDEARNIRWGHSGYLLTTLIITHGRIANLLDGDVGPEQIAVDRSSLEKPVMHLKIPLRVARYTLGSIAATLSQEQDSIIRDEPHGISLISGVAGSGKTNVAFHRLDYLLKQHQDSFHANNIAYFCPRLPLRHYVTSLRREMGFSEMELHEYAEWLYAVALERAGVRRGSRESNAGERSAKADAETANACRPYAFKLAAGAWSAVVGDKALAAYADEMRAAYCPFPALSSSGTGPAEPPGGALGAAAVAETLATVVMREAARIQRTQASVLYGRREALEQAIADDMQSADVTSTVVSAITLRIQQTCHSLPGYGSAWKTLSSVLEEEKERLNGEGPRGHLATRLAVNLLSAEAVQSIDTFLDRVYDPANKDVMVARKIKTAGRKAISRIKKHFMQEAGLEITSTKYLEDGKVEFTYRFDGKRLLKAFYEMNPQFTAVAAELGEQKAPVMLTQCDATLLAHIIYWLSWNPAHLRTTGFPRRYDHIVVDEAEEFTPAELALLNLIHAQSMTVAGDITQRSLNTGVRDWRSLPCTVEKSRRHELRTTYRVTLETVLFANATVTTGTPALLPQHVVSRGAHPWVARCSSPEDVFWNVSKLVKQMQHDDSRASIVIASPTNSALKDVLDYLTGAGISAYIGRKNTWEFGKKVTVTTWRRLQGLEYDHVIVVGLEEFEHDGITPEKEHIAYMVFTRAIQRLYIFLDRSRSQLVERVRPDLYDSPEETR